VRAVLAPILREVSLRQADAAWWINSTSSRCDPLGTRQIGLGLAAQGLLTAEDKAAYKERLAALVAP